MHFLHPTFLLALGALMVPVIIHLFNLRRYKKQYFPHTKFLKQLNIQSRKPKRIQERLLLALRMLFLAALVLAFAQPATKKAAIASNQVLYAIFIDNSNSMSARSGATDLLAKAKASAHHLINALPGHAQIVIVTHDAPQLYDAVDKEKALHILDEIAFSSATRQPREIKQQLLAMQQNENLQAIHWYFFSDFQKNIHFQPLELGTVDFTGIQMQAKSLSNSFIDTAWLLDAGLAAQNKLVVRSKINTSDAVENRILQLAINGKMVSAVTTKFDDKGLSIDTLFFTTEQDGWQKIQVHLQEDALQFDDTFRLTARLSTALEIAHLTGGNPSPYVMAALHSDPKTAVTQQSWASYSLSNNRAQLIVLEGIRQLSAADGVQLRKAMEKGTSVFIIPDKNENFQSFNPGLRELAPIGFSGLNAEPQLVTSLYSQHELVKDIFVHIPKQVQLPSVNWHYVMHSTFSANRQSVMTFRNTDPFLASFQVGRARLYLLTSSASLEGGNFAGSYFFAPFIHQMALLNKGGNTFALRSGTGQSVVVPIQAGGERNLLHLMAEGKDFIPVQKASGNGVAIYPDAATTQSGFYLTTAPGADSAWIALNPNISESQLTYYSLKELNELQAGKMKFKTVNDFMLQPLDQAGGQFPFWKVCVLLALLLLAAECALLWRNLKLNARKTPPKISSI